MYSTLLPLLLIGPFHACLSHSGDPTITCSQQKDTQCPDQHHRHRRARRIRRRSLPSRLLPQITQSMVLQHQRDLCRQQGHKVTHKIPVGIVEAPVHADRQHRPVLQEPLRLRRPTPGTAGHPTSLLQSQRKGKWLEQGARSRGMCEETADMTHGHRGGGNN